MDNSIIFEGKPLEQFKHKRIFDIDLRSYQYKENNTVKIAPFFGMMKSHVKKDEKNDYTGLQIHSDDAQISILLNDVEMIDEIINILEECKNNSFTGKRKSFELKRKISCQ